MPAGLNAMIDRVIGNYRIVEKVGEGGMGTVYRALDVMLEREVAIKAIRPELSREPEIVERFRVEAKMLARLSHPAIATIYSFFVDGEDVFLAMEFVRGRSLSGVLQSAGPLPWERAVPLLAGALDGIEQAHRVGIVHRDLKSDNLMVTESGTVKVMDFGIARLIGSSRLTRTGLLVGTLHYMAPEQIRGEEVDRRTDVYALGAVLYEMLTGRVPFQGSSDYAVLKAHVEEHPAPPSAAMPGLPPWLDRAILKALAKAPAERFQTVEELRLCLLHCLVLQRRINRGEQLPLSYVLVEVSDSGTGIPAAIVDKIFEPFFSTKEVGKGTGLGLSTVYGIIKQTGGFVYVDSVEGKGTTFRIFLPRHVASAQDAAPEHAAEAQVSSLIGVLAAAAEAKPPANADLTGVGTILLVEDEEGLRALNARGLTSRGYTVLEAGNGVEAIDVLEKIDGRVDLVVSDVVMPEMDGPTLLRELRSRDPSLKIIFVSGYAEDAFQKHLPADGQQFAFLAKPFTLKQLVAAVKETMAA